MDNNVKKLLDELNFEDYGYPYTDIGYVMFLKELHIELEVYGGEGENYGKWYYCIVDNRSSMVGIDYYSSDEYDTFEDAFNDGLIKCLKYAIEEPEY